MQNEFGLVLRQRRMQFGLTPENLAQVLGVDPPVVSRVEQGLCPVPAKILILWANALKVPPEEIVYLYLNLNAKKMMAEAGIRGRFKIVAVGDENGGL